MPKQLPAAAHPVPGAPRLVTVAELCATLRCHRSSLRRWGLDAYALTLGQQKRYNLDEVLAALRPDDEGEAAG